MWFVKISLPAMTISIYTYIYHLIWPNIIFNFSSFSLIIRKISLKGYNFLLPLNYFFFNFFSIFLSNKFHSNFFIKKFVLLHSQPFMIFNHELVYTQTDLEYGLPCVFRRRMDDVLSVCNCKANILHLFLPQIALAWNRLEEISKFLLKTKVISLLLLFDLVVYELVCPIA